MFWCWYCAADHLVLNYSKWPEKIRGSLLVLYLLALWFSILNWVHNGAHMSGPSPPNYVYLALIEYVFHVPWLILAVTLALVVRQLVRANKKQA